MFDPTNAIDGGIDFGSPCLVNPSRRKYTKWTQANDRGGTQCLVQSVYFHFTNKNGLDNIVLAQRIESFYGGACILGIRNTQTNAQPCKPIRVATHRAAATRANSSQRWNNEALNVTLLP